MSNFVRKFPLGAPLNGELPSEAIDYYDVALPKVPNFTDGSVHSAGAVVELDGFGMLFTDAVRIHPDGAIKATWQTGAGVDVLGGGSQWTFKSGSQLIAEAGAAITVAGELEVAGTGDLLVDGEAFFGSGSNLFFAGDLIEVSAGAVVLTGTSVDLDCATTFTANADPQLLSGCAATFQGGATCTFASGATCTVAAGANLVVNGSASFDGNVGINASATLTQTGMHVKAGATARSRDRVSTLTNNADQTIDVDNDHYFYEQTTNVTRTITVSLSSPTPEDGESITMMVRNTSTSLVHIDNAGADAGVHIFTVAASTTCSFGMIYSASAGRWRAREGGRSSASDLLYGSDA